MTYLCDVELFSRVDRADDASLLAGLAIGDEAASTAFVRRFQAAVYGLALSVTREPGLAEDVSQEVFVRAWRAAGSYDARRASVLTWLLTITRNAAIDSVRTRRPPPYGGHIGAADRCDAPGRGTGTACYPRAGEQTRRATAPSLPTEQARAVVLAVIGGCTAAEVGRHEDIPLGTAKTRIRAGLRRLRDSLKEDSRDR